MLTPQDIQNQEFAKAVFGGYDMAAVDDFLEQLTADYAALYKDNMVLKGKLKVLVDKVEEYRSTEDAMRMALLTAQKMSDDMMAETKAKCDEMLSDAARASDESRAKAMEDITHEDMKLEAAKIKTSAFVAASRQIIEQYQAFLDKLDTVTAEYGGAKTDPNDKAEPEHEPVVSPEPERAHKPAAPAATPAPAAAPAPAPAPEPETEPESEAQEPATEAPREPEIPTYEDPLPPEGVDTSLEDDDVKTAPPVNPDGPTRRIDLEAVRRIYSGDGSTKRIAWDEEDELTTPRPKFNFDDLQFGANYDENPKKKKKDK